MNPAWQADALFQDEVAMALDTITIDSFTAAFDTYLDTQYKQSGPLRHSKTSTLLKAADIDYYWTLYNEWVADHVKDKIKLGDFYFDRDEFERAGRKILAEIDISAEDKDALKRKYSL